MKFSIESLYPHEWQKLAIEEDGREILVRHFEPSSLQDAVDVVNAAAEVVAGHGFQDEVQFSLDAKRIMITIHYSGAGPLEESHFELAGAIDVALELS